MLSSYTSLERYWTFSRRQLWLCCHISALGFVTNLLVLQLPLLAPLLLGNTAFLAILLRLGPFWGLASFAVVALPLWGAWFWWLSLAEFMLVLMAWRSGRQSISQLYLHCWLVLVPAVFLYLFWLQSISIGFAALISLILCLGGGMSLVGAKLILNVAISTRLSRQQPLSEQLAGRITVYSAVPTLVLILAALHAFVAWDLNKRHEQLLRLERQFLTFSAYQLRQFRTTLQQAALNYPRYKDERILDDLLQLQPHFISAAVTDQHGDVISYRFRGGQQLMGSVNVSDRDYFQQLQLKPVGTYVSDAYVGRGLGDDLLFAVSAPMLNSEQQFIGIVQSSVLLSSLAQQLQPSDSPEQIRAVLLDNQDKQIWSVPFTEGYGQLFLRGSDFLPGKRVFINSWFLPEGGVQLNQDGRGFIRSHQTDDGWLLLMHYQLDAVLFGYNILTLIVILLVGLAIWLLNRTSFYFVRFYSRPLRQLVQSIQRLELQTDAPFCDLSARASGLEVQQLFDEYNAMVVRLHQARNRLEELNASLEQRVKKRTEELANERDRATQLAQVKSRFLATMSHELRTPLTAIIGYTEQLQLGQLLNAKQQQQLEVISRNSNYLLSIVNDILDAAKLEEGKLSTEVQSVAIKKLLQDLCSDMTKLATSKGLRLDFCFDDRIPVWLRLDPQRLQQILLNLLSNAIKFTEQGSIQVQACRSSSHRLQISVKDTGIGMTMEQLDKVFSAFEQADSGTSRRYGGTGLGLHISSQLAELMQGELSVSSEPGRGSLFTLELPLMEPEASSIDVAAKTSVSDISIPRLAGKALVVDDVDDIRLLVVDLLQQSGLTVIAAKNGAEAVQWARKQAFDLILMDMNMPVLDGAEATRQLRAAGFTLPILALTADVLPEDRALFLQAGCNEVLSKPIEPALLYQALARYLQQPSAPADSLPAVAPAAGMSASERIAALKQRYVEQLPEKLEQLQLLLEQQDEAELAALLHQLKGTAGSFGFQRVSAVAAGMEQQLKARQPMKEVDCTELAAAIAAAQSESP
ncbi:ATP-binding protein [Alkalimonas amylolytica]|uniref:histidine kinase n=1 Tax=Alkalimonas amylolytica TaxID=152573 RepID=A0A1H4BE86_ALKAM|nr:ATP-binding protein [Alkalimonas amylolytica]SEA46450.1 Signal transduction histidine kinase [Alkalimonas amylolytica]